MRRKRLSTERTVSNKPSAEVQTQHWRSSLGPMWTGPGLGQQVYSRMMCRKRGQWRHGK